MAVPVFYFQIVLPKVKMLFFMTHLSASMRALAGMPGKTLPSRYFPTNNRALSVGMLVYIETASAVNNDALEGSSRVSISFRRSKLLLKYEGCILTAC